MPSRTARGTTVVIGDVHGDRARLGAMLHRLSGHQGQIVLVGDYVNRGPDASGVLELLVEARAVWRHRIVLLEGNHEGGLLRYLDTGDFAEFAAMGGMSTIRSYVGVAQHQKLARLVQPGVDDGVRRRGGVGPPWVRSPVLVAPGGA